MEDLQRAMSGTFFDETAEGVDGESDGEGEGAEFWETAGVSSEAGRFASPEKISSPAFFPSIAGRSGAAAAESRIAAKERAAWGSTAPVLAGDLGEKAAGVAGFTALTETTELTATEGDWIDGANGDGFNDGESDKPGPLVRGNEPPIWGRIETTIPTPTD